jgi:hypothetical protein
MGGRRADPLRSAIEPGGYIATNLFHETDRIYGTSRRQTKRHRSGSFATAAARCRGLIAREQCADRTPIVLIFEIKNLLIPALSCRSCRPIGPFAELGRLSRTSIANEMRDKHRAQVLSE